MSADEVRLAETESIGYRSIIIVAQTRREQRKAGTRGPAKDDRPKTRSTTRLAAAEQRAELQIGRLSSSSTITALAIVATILLVCLIPFVNKAIHIDDPLFIW